MNHICIVTLVRVCCALTIAIMPYQAAAMPQSESTVTGRIDTGTVVETMSAAGYTYMLVARNNQQIWVASPATDVAVGSEVGYLEGMVMENFTSKTLGKTFPTVLFSPGLAPKTAIKEAKATGDDSFAKALQAEQAASLANPIVDQAEGGATFSGGSSVAVAPLQEITVTKAPGENGLSVAEVFDRTKEFEGKKIRVRGKVVKFSPNIMTRNWLHLQDGTGNPLHNTHDLVVTTSETVAVDTIVMLEGVLAKDKDFGAGYKYTTLVEQAQLVK